MTYEAFNGIPFEPRYLLLCVLIHSETAVVQACLELLFLHCESLLELLLSEKSQVSTVLVLLLHPECGSIKPNFFGLSTLI